MKPPLPAVLHGTGLLLAFAAGWWLKPAAVCRPNASLPSAPPSAKPSDLPSAKNNPGAAASTWVDSTTSDLSAILSARKTGVVNEVLLAHLKSTLSMGDRSIREPRWETLLTAMRPEDAAAVKELFHLHAKEGRHFNREFQKFCFRWGQVDGPTAAPRIFSEYAGNDDALSEVMTGWGSRDGTSSMDWAKQQTDLIQRSATLAAIKGIGSRSLAEAEALMLADPDKSILQRHFGEIAQMKVDHQGLTEALPWFDEIAGGPAPAEYKKANLERLLAIMNKGSDARDAISLVKRYAAEEWLPQSAGVEIAADLIGGDADAFFNEIGNMASQEARASAIMIFMEQWTPEAASEWLSAHPRHPVFDEVAIRLVNDLANTDPEAASVWASQIKRPDTRSSAENLIRMQESHKKAFSE